MGGDGSGALLGGGGLHEVELVTLLEGRAGDGLEGVFEVGGVDGGGEGDVDRREGGLVRKVECYGLWVGSVRGGLLVGCGRDGMRREVRERTRRPSR